MLHCLGHWSISTLTPSRTRDTHLPPLQRPILDHTFIIIVTQRIRLLVHTFPLLPRPGMTVVSPSRDSFETVYDHSSLHLGQMDRPKREVWVILRPSWSGCATASTDRRNSRQRLGALVVEGLMRPLYQHWRCRLPFDLHPMRLRLVWHSGPIRSWL